MTDCFLLFSKMNTNYRRGFSLGVPTGMGVRVGRVGKAKSHAGKNNNTHTRMYIAYTNGL